ncbi:MAG: hypothetical protein M1820_003154 [Bogoriella megaspora]|nr:MAG: hypothetical protein M1820_003154 [Bogoriella megaspora]
MSGPEILGAIAATLELGKATNKGIETLKNSRKEIAELRDNIGSTLEMFLEVDESCSQEENQEVSDDEHHQRIRQIQSKRLKQACDRSSSELHRVAQDAQLLLLVDIVRRKQPTRGVFESRQGTGLAKNAKVAFRSLLDSLDIHKSSGIRIPSQQLENELEKVRRSQPTWVFRQNEYRDWQSSDSSDWLWAFGEAGSGKTALASYMVDALRASHSTVPPPDSVSSADQQNNSCARSDVAVAIFYYSYEVTPFSQRPEIVLRSLCHQLLENLWRKDPYQAFQRVDGFDFGKEHSTSLRAIRELFKALVIDFGRVYIILDALDGSSRETIVKIMVTSRIGDDMKVSAAFNKSHCLEVKPTKELLHHYVTGRLEYPTDFTEEPEILESLRDNVERICAINKIVDASEGSYLPAKLHLDMLGQTSTRVDLESRLENLPTNLASLFSPSLRRIENQADERLRLFGNKTLLWMLHAERPLSIEELQHAVAIHRFLPMSYTELNLRPTDIPTMRELVTATSYLLSIDLVNNTVHVHKAIQDFFMENPGKIEMQRHFINPHYEMVCACMGYLRLGNFKSYMSGSSSIWLPREPDFPFFGYTTRDWATHVKRCGERMFYQSGTSSPILDFLNMDHALACTAQLLEQPGIDVDERNPYWETALCTACFHGHAGIVQILLKAKADSLSGNGSGTLEVSQARHKHDSMSSASIVHMPFTDHCLAAAARKGYLVVINLLIDHARQGRYSKALLAQENHRGEPIVVNAVRSNNVIVVQAILDQVVLLSEGMQLLLKYDRSGHDALRVAVQLDNEYIIEALVQYPGGGTLLDRRGPNKNETPLHTATENNYYKAAERLLDLGTNPSIQDSDGNTLLHLLFVKVDRSLEVVIGGIIENFLKRGADPSIQTFKKRETVVHRAVVCDQPKALRTLIRNLINHGPSGVVNIPGSHGFTPLQLAISKPSLKNLKDIFEILIVDGRADCRGKDDKGQPCLLAIMKRRDPALLDTVCKCDRFNEYADAALIYAIELHLPEQFHRMVEAISSNQQVTLKSNVVSAVLSNGCADFLNILFELGFGNSVLKNQSPGGWSPLHQVANQGHIEFANILIDQGANISVRNDAGASALDLAVAKQLPDMAMLLQSQQSTRTCVMKYALPSLNKFDLSIPAS